MDVETLKQQMVFLDDDITIQRDKLHNTSNTKEKLATLKKVRLLEEKHRELQNILDEILITQEKLDTEKDCFCVKK